MSEIIKDLLLVGAGNWGKNLARNFYKLGALHSICDSRQTILDTYTSLYPNIFLTTSYKEALQSPKITKVAIAAPASMHYDLAKQALLANKDVYVEKPLCLDVDEAKDLISLASSRERILMVGHLLQYHPCVRRLQQMIQSGELGKLQYLVSNRLNLGSIRTEENALWSFAPHDISVILSLCGHQLPSQVRCVGEAYLSQGIADTTMTILRFEGGIRAHIYVSWLHPYKEQKLIAIGTSGMAIFDDMKPWGEKLQLFKNHVTWTQGNIPRANKVEPECFEITPLEPLQEECSHFLNCCKTRAAPLTNGEEGLRVLKVLQAAQASLDEDGEIQSPQEFKRKNPHFFAHPSAIISEKASIGEGTKIWHFTHIMSGAIVGRECNIGQNVVVSPEVTLGNQVKIQNNVSVYSGVICEDQVFLGPSVVFTNVINPRSFINRRGEYQKTLVKRGATIGANATIVCGVELGEFCFIGAGAVIVKDVKPYALIVGNPGKQIGWMSRHGERLDLPVSTEADNERIAVCSLSGEQYCLRKDTLFPLATFQNSQQESIMADANA